MDNKRLFDVVLMEPAEQQMPSTKNSKDMNNVSYCEQLFSTWFLVNMYAAPVVALQMLRSLPVITIAIIRLTLHIVID